LKVDLNVDHLYLIKQSLEEITIKGKDSHAVSALLSKIQKAFEREVAKQDG
tara:strand:+ start:1572 stop:1724 length:153 start_codon:yes stop_codon:yes gene_type:complete